jgi:hypothetical protein
MTEAPPAAITIRRYELACTDAAATRVCMHRRAERRVRWENILMEGERVAV